MGQWDVAVGERAAPAARWAADDALTELYAAHWHRLVRLSYLLVRDQQVAEETVQDAFVAMHRRWHDLREPDLALAYLRRSVVNGSRSVLRHREVERRHLPRLHSLPGVGADRRTTVASAEQEALDHETGDRLLHALSALPDRQREVLVLRYYLDLSEAQIADALQISAGSVKAHAHRGLRALRQREEVGEA
ncbi:MAG TPA: SigE family RNA polymerase sigma factor [Segeticoccus sp.]|nr:SigE family RNA polymerase sigma factor [Segeticoccus sp.]